MKIVVIQNLNVHFGILIQIIGTQLDVAINS